LGKSPAQLGVQIQTLGRFKFSNDDPEKSENGKQRREEAVQGSVEKDMKWGEGREAESEV